MTILSNWCVDYQINLSNWCVDNKIYTLSSYDQLNEVLVCNFKQCNTLMRKALYLHHVTSKDIMVEIVYGPFKTLS